MGHSHGHDAHMDPDSVNCTHMDHHNSMSTGHHGAVHHGMMVGCVFFDGILCHFSKICNCCNLL